MKSRPKSIKKRGIAKKAKRAKKAAAKRPPVIKKKTRKGAYPKAELKKFRRLLLAQREVMVGEVEHITNDTLKTSQRDASGDLSGYTMHMADVAGDHYDREFSLGIASSEQGTIYDIDEALKRIEDGTYGVCFTCESPISKSRLKAIPHAKYCVSCQQKEESIQKRAQAQQ